MAEEQLRQFPNQLPEAAPVIRLTVSSRYKYALVFGILILTGLLLAVIGSSGQKIPALRTSGAMLFSIGVVAESVYLCMYCSSCYRKATRGDSTTETSTSAYYERRFALEQALAERTGNPASQTPELHRRSLQPSQSRESEPPSYEELVTRCIIQPLQDATGSTPAYHDSSPAESHESSAKLDQICYTQPDDQDIARDRAQTETENPSPRYIQANGNTSGVQATSMETV